MQKSRNNSKNIIIVYAVLILIIAALAVSSIWLVSGLSARAAVVREAEAHRFLTARSSLFDAIFVSKKLQSYVEAGVLYENKNYDAAENRFKELGKYRDSDYMMNASRIRSVYKRSLLGALNPDLYFELKALSIELDRYSELVGLANECMNDLKPRLYDLAAEAYRRGEREKAELYFAEFDAGYKRTQGYRVLITCRRMLVPGADEAVIQACYDALLTCLDLEDAAGLILTNTDIAVKFMEGSWRSADGRYRFSITHELVESGPEELNEISRPVVIDPDAVPAQQYAAAAPEQPEPEAEPVYELKVSYNLPDFGIRAVSFEINDCVFSCSNGKNNLRDTFRIGIINKNQVVFYCFYNGNRITLDRQGQ